MNAAQIDLFSKSSADDPRTAFPIFEKGTRTPTSPKELRLVRVDWKVAERLNRMWHSRLPEIANARMCQCFAFEFENMFYAVALWSTPSNQNMYKQGCYELRRLAISPDAPKFTASRMLSLMAKKIRITKTNIKKLISYQDTEVHKGTIYKASGWFCAGKTHQGGKCGWNNNVRFRKEVNGKAPLESVKHRWELVIR